MYAHQEQEMGDAQLAKRARRADQAREADRVRRQMVPDLAVCGNLLIESDSPARLRLYGSLDLDSALELDAGMLSHRLLSEEPPLTLDLAGLVEVERRALQLLQERQRLALRDGAYLLLRLSAAQAVHVL